MRLVTGAEIWPFWERSSANGPNLSKQPALSPSFEHNAPLISPEWKSLQTWSNLIFRRLHAVTLVTLVLFPASPANCIIKSRTHQQDGRRSALLSCIVFHLLCKREITVFTVLELWQTVSAKFCAPQSSAYFIKCHGLILPLAMVSNCNLCPHQKYHKLTLLERLCTQELVLGKTIWM